MYFNPRTRVGCDLVKIGLPIILSVISIHAPAWGATAKMHKIIYKKETRCVKTLSISFSLSLPQIK